MKAEIVGRLLSFGRCFVTGANRAGRTLNRDLVVWLIFISGLGLLPAGVAAYVYGLAILVVPGIILFAVIVWLTILEGAYIENEELRKPRSGIIGFAPSLSITRPITNSDRAQLDTWSPTGRGWFTFGERPLTALQFITPRGPIVRPADCPKQFKPPIGLKDRWEQFVHDLPRPVLIVQQFRENRVEIEEVNYERKRLVLELYSEAEPTMSSSPATLPEP